MSDTVTAAEMRVSVNELSNEFDDVRRRADRMTGSLRLAAREAPDNLTKAAIASEARAHESFLGSLGRARHVLAQIDRDLAKLEAEAAKGYGYAMPAAHPEIAGLPFMAKKAVGVRRPGGVPFHRPAATESVASYAGAIHEALRATAASVAEEIRRADLTKAAGDDATDPGDYGIDDLAPAAFLTLAAILAIASRIARGLDLSGLHGLASDATPGEFAADVVGEALAGLGLDIPPAVAEQIQTSATKTATARAHELVGLRQEHGGPVGDPGAQRAITNSTRDMVEAAIVDGLQNGQDANAIADSIGAIDAFGEQRAMEIATNELRGVNSNAAVEAYQGAALATGATILKAWFVDPASEFCDDCRQNEAQGPIPLDAQFQSGDDNPPMHPRCRCSVEPVVSNPASSKAFQPMRPAAGRRPVPFDEPTSRRTLH